MSEIIPPETTEKPVQISAATLVLMREQAAEKPQVLMVERSQNMVFAGGAAVFPGGRIDPDDYALADRFKVSDRDCAAARVAAIRETLEETGVPIAIMGASGLDWLADARASLHKGEVFSAILDRFGLTLDLDALIPFARWCPNFKESRTFDTRFYLVDASGDLPEAKVDSTENVRLFWATAEAALARADAGDIKIIYPTRRNLERVALWSDFASAKAHADSIPVRLIEPWMEVENGQRFLCIPDGLGYPITRESMQTALRAGR
jgi:8-oxo-dGTP pyrophosphatase MutT (NUDIX family)